MTEGKGVEREEGERKRAGGKGCFLSILRLLLRSHYLAKTARKEGRRGGRGERGEKGGGGVKFI